MRRLFINDWKCCALRLIAVSSTAATMIFTTFDHRGFPYLLSLIAILFIGLSMRRAEKVSV